MYCIAMTEISEEEEQALLEIQLDNMALEEQPTVAASTSDIMRQLQALQNQMNQLLEQQQQQQQQQQQEKKKKRPRRNPYQRRRGRGRGRGRAKYLLLQLYIHFLKLKRFF